MTPIRAPFRPTQRVLFHELERMCEEQEVDQVARALSRDDATQTETSAFEEPASEVKWKFEIHSIAKKSLDETLCPSAWPNWRHGQMRMRS
jgi:hypothetical protein